MMSKFTKYIKWGLSIIAAIFAVIEFLDFFKVYDFSGVGIKGLGIVVIIAIIITISKAFLEKKNKPSDAQNRINEINGKITDRIGVLRSSQKPDETMLDAIHELTSIERMDILDYSTRDYMSYRIILGKNVSKNASPFLKYKESTDSKTSAKELKIVAFDLKSGKELKIEFAEKNQKVYEHNFHILFTTPLKPNEEFSIAYYMKIPNELEQLSDNEEMMSISLNRFEKRISKLIFGMYLDFVPAQVETFMRKEDGSAHLIDCTPIIEETSEVQIDERFKEFISGTEVSSKIQIEIEKPEHETYVIYYRK